MKKAKKEIEVIKSKFYTLDSSKPIAAEGTRSAFPFVLLLVAILFCGILAFIIIVNQEETPANDPSYTVFYILCGVMLGVALIVNIAYIVRKIVIRKRILSADVTRATITFVAVEEYTTRDNDGDTHTKERVSLTYEFYDRFGNKRAEHFSKTYGRAPDFYEGQQIVVAFDDAKCYVLSKYTLLDDDAEAETVTQNPNKQALSSETLNVKKDKYFPLGYDMRYYILAGVYLAFALFFATMLTYYAITVKDVYVWAFVGAFGIFLAVFLVLAISAALIPFKAKRRYDWIETSGATFTHGLLEYTNKVYGNGAAGKCICKYADIDGNEKQFNVNASLVRKRIRYADTEVIVAYAQDKAVVLIPKEEVKITLR